MSDFLLDVRSPRAELPRRALLCTGICLLALAACEEQPPATPLTRLEPLLRGSLPHVVSPLPEDEGFLLTISPSEQLSRTVRAGLSVRAADGRSIPYHLFDCHDVRARTLDRSPAIAITPGTVRFCHLFVPSAEEVRRIVLHPQGERPVDLYREGDPLGEAPSVVLRPAQINHRQPESLGVDE